MTPSINYAIKTYIFWHKKSHGRRMGHLFLVQCFHLIPNFIKTLLRVHAIKNIFVNPKAANRPGPFFVQIRWATFHQYYRGLPAIKIDLTLAQNIAQIYYCGIKFFLGFLGGFKCPKMNFEKTSQ